MMVVLRPMAQTSPATTHEALVSKLVRVDLTRARRTSGAQDRRTLKDGVEGLKARWAELEFVLRSPITCESTLVESQTKVEAASKFLADLESTAEEVDLLQGIILQSIVGDGQGRGGEGSALV